MTGPVWFDGALSTVEDARVSVFDHAFTVGDAVFETMKVVDGTPFALTRHLRRLAVSAAGLGLPDPGEGRVAHAVAELLAQPRAEPHSRMRITYGGGDAPMGSGRGSDSPHLAITLGTSPAWEPTTDVVTVPWVRNERSAVVGLKTTSYAENVVAVESAHARGATEALFANTRGELCEGTGSNVFLVLDGTLVTPPLRSGCLAGITRELVIEWCGAVEQVIDYAELDRAEEVFLTSSTRDVQPVAAVDGQRVPSAPGARTVEAMAEFTRRSSLEVDP